MDRPPAAGTSPEDARAVFSYDGKLSELFGLFLVNLLLTIITCGLFHFWAITRMRRYLWSHMHFEGMPFRYTGKGKELLQGFLLAMLILVLLFVCAAVVEEMLKKANLARAPMPYVTATVGAFVLLGAVRFAALRYRLSRTEWGGVSGGMGGTALRYGANWMIYLLACVVTLAQVLPWMQVGLARWRINACHFGAAEFHCGARGRQLYLPWLGLIFGHVVLVGVVAAIVAGFEGPWLAHAFFGRSKGPIPPIAVFRIIPAIVGGVAIVIGSTLLITSYHAKFIHIILAKTTAFVRGSFRTETLRFTTTAEVDSLAWLAFTNLVIAVLTLGLGSPVVLHRNARFLARTTRMTGALDANTVAQGALAASPPAKDFAQTLHPSIIWRTK